ncbi:hypothetical protein SIE_02115 [Enterococcus faecium EnGen0153]|nr:hypothetical protein SIE_02115 [Enterococcus faecium EnGen0153]
MTNELRNRGFSINKKKVQRLIKKLGIKVTAYTRKSRRYNSYRGKVGAVAKNRIHRRFYTSICHQKITTDTTEFKYHEVDAKGIMDLSQYLGHILVETVKPFFLLLILQIPVGLDSESSYGFDFGYKILQCS